MALKKAIFYNFYPSCKTEEEPTIADSSATEPRYHRMLVEIRDLHPLPMLNPDDPWQIKKTLNHYEVASGKIIVSFNDTFQYILRHWDFLIAKHLAIIGDRIAVHLWDFTNHRNPTLHKGDEVYFQMTHGENYILSCKGMMRKWNLNVNNKIGLYWDSNALCFCFKVFY